jgi:metal transporter CNNM
MIYLTLGFLVIMSALFSGLTLGLMSLSVHELNRKMQLGSRAAARVYRVRKRGNLLLTTLLLGNVAVNSVLAIILSDIASGVLAGFLATGLIFLFGEIIPQAVISRYALAFGARTWWLVEAFMILAFPIAGPIAWILDKVLGQELPTVYSKRELMHIVAQHEDTPESLIDQDEERIILGALQYSDKRVKDVMTPAHLVNLVEVHQSISKSFIRSMRKIGHSRIPVYRGDPSEIIGILYMKHLLGSTAQTVQGIYDKNIHSIQATDTLDDVLNAFLKTRQHLFVVVDTETVFQGIVTLEDVIEEILGVEIVDEDDHSAYLRAQAQKKK